MKCETLEHCIKVYVPSKFGPEQNEDWTRHNKLVEIIRAILIGSTSYRGIGDWEGITETVDIVESYCAEIDEFKIESIARKILAEEQQAAAIAIDGELRLYSE